MTSERGDRPKSALWTMTSARVRVFVREPAALFWVFVFPVFLAIGLGIAFRDRPPEPVRAAVDSASPGAERLAALLADADGVALERQPASELERRFHKGSVDVIVALSPPAHLDYRFDPARPEGRLARMVVDDAIERALGRQDRATLTEHTEIPKGARYIDFLLPGLIALNLMSSALWGLGYAVVQERRGKLLRRFAVTPMRRADFLLSFILSRLLFLAIEVAALMVFGDLVFDVTLYGSAIDLAVFCLVGGLAFNGLGVLVGSRTESAEVAGGLVNLATLPMWILSGTFFSYERFPEVFHPIIRALPLTALNDGLRAIVNDGEPLVALWPQLAVLAAWGIVCFAVALRIFRWR